MSSKVHFRRRSNAALRRGAVLVEFVFVAIFFLIMLFGLIQYGVIISSLNTLQQVTREGARYYSVHFNDSNDTAETTAYMQTVAKGSFLNNSDISNGVTIGTPVTNGSLQINNPVQVAISYDMSKRTFFGGFVPGVKTGTNIVTRSTVTVIEGSN